MTTKKMPVLFVGHGNPINALSDNPFTRSLAGVAASLPEKPAAVLVVSAHWLTRDTFAATTNRPETIHDFEGFPEELYAFSYPAPGAPLQAERAASLSRRILRDNRRGLDHGAWSVLTHLFPKADVPAFQLSIDLPRPLHHHLKLARELAALRNEGVLIIGSGNIVHNLQLVQPDPVLGFDWAVEFDAWVKKKIDARDFMGLVNYEKAGKAAELSVPTLDHFAPLIYTAGLIDSEDAISYFHEGVVHGSIGMRCLRAG
jgi:4,5-DOPA dioxygenase extradiol